MKNANLRASLWFVAFVILSAWMVFGWLRFPPGARLGSTATPFERTAGLPKGHWAFLQQVRGVLPAGATYTVRAASTDDEMGIFQLAGSVLDEHEGIPTFYFGAFFPDAATVRWILSYRCEVVPPDATVVSRLPDGCVCERTN